MKTLKSLAIAAAILATAANSRAALFTYNVTLNGATEIPSNFSPGFGFGTVTIDNVTNTMTSFVNFQTLTGITISAALFGATAVPFTGSAGLASNNFTTFPVGVNFGVASGTLNMTQTSSYDPGFLAANGGTAASAFAALKSFADSGRTYIDIKTSTFPAGEIRGYLTPVPEPTSACLLAIGAGMGLMRRRRSAARNV